MNRGRTILSLLALLHGGRLSACAARPAGLPLGRSPRCVRVKTEILADTSLAPGKPFLVAVTLTTSPSWHIYWSNPGDAGVATSFDWKVPPGFIVEPLPFPIPTAFVQPGDIRVLGYEGKTTFLFRVVPAGGNCTPTRARSA